MLNTLKARVSVILLTGLVLIGIINTSVFGDKTYAGTSETAELLTTRVNHTTTPEVVTFGNEEVTLDLSNASYGYFGVKYIGENDRVKLIVSKIGAEDIMYDIPKGKYGKYAMLPFHAGSGEYEISVWESLG